jgi:septum formation protein
MTAPILWLASASPRRLELLRQIGIEPACRVSGVDESPLPGEAALAYSQRIALAKAAVVWHSLDEAERAPVLGADTEVVLDGRTLGKPRDAADAARMLRALQGRRHQVLSSVALFHAGAPAGEVRVQQTEVEFAPLDEAAIARYLATGEAMDKAGAYAIQGRAAAFIRRIEGSYSGVMGLPLHETAELLARAGIVP